MLGVCLDMEDTPQNTLITVRLACTYAVLLCHTMVRNTVRLRFIIVIIIIINVPMREYVIRHAINFPGYIVIVINYCKATDVPMVVGPGHSMCRIYVNALRRAQV